MRLRPFLLLTPLVLLVWLLAGWGAYSAWVHGADHRDFYPRWAGARLALLQGRDLYSPDTTRAMQRLLYGRDLPPGRDQQGFAYPAQLVVILFPFWLIPDVEIATAAWQGLSLLLLLAALLLARSLSSPRPPPLLLAALLLWQYPLLMLFQGQITALVLFSLVLGSWAFHRRSDHLAGAALSLAVIKPELALLPWLAFLVLAIRQRRWIFLATFTAAGAVLFLLSLLVAGWWLPGWLAALRAYSGYAQTVWAPSSAFGIHPLLVLPLLALVAAALTTTWPRPLPTFAAALAAGLLLLPQTPIWGLTVLIVPLALAGGRPTARWSVAAVWLLGWLAIFLPPASWRVQSVLLPALTLIAIILSTLPLPNTGPARIKSMPAFRQ